MNAARLAVEILLWFAVAVAWLSCVGLLVMDHVFDKLHYLAPVTTVSMFAIVAAVVIEEGAGQAAMKSLVVAVGLLLINAVVSHATARAHRAQELGDWKPQEGESFPGMEDVPALRKGPTA